MVGLDCHRPHSDRHRHRLSVLRIPRDQMVDRRDLLWFARSSAAAHDPQAIRACDRDYVSDSEAMAGSKGYISGAALLMAVTPTRGQRSLIGTGGAPRIDGTADVLAPCHEIQIDVWPPSRLRRTIQRLLCLLWRVGANPAEAIRNPVHVRVDADILAALIGEDQHEVRGLASNAWQCEQLFHRGRCLAAEILQQFGACRLDVTRFVTVEADRINQLLDLLDGQLRHRFGCAGLLEQPL